MGSLLLGLYDDEGLLHHVGFTSAIAAAEKPELTLKRLQQLIAPNRALPAMHREGRAAGRPRALPNGNP